MPASTDSAYLYKYKGDIIDANTRQIEGITDFVVFHDDRFTKHGRPEYITFTISRLHNDNSGNVTWTQLPLEEVRRFTDALGSKLNRIDTWYLMGHKTPLVTQEFAHLYTYSGPRLDDEEHKAYATDKISVFHDTRFMYFGQPEYITFTSIIEQDNFPNKYGVVQLPLHEAEMLHKTLRDKLAELDS